MEKGRVKSDLSPGSERRRRAQIIHILSSYLRVDKCHYYFINKRINFASSDDATAPQAGRVCSSDRCVCSEKPVSAVSFSGMRKK
ncbi:hypothetical protein [Erwinia sp. 9145]|uniref:hypothetical protein n=1 Tax=Erwinia sp. 9145 TaxID=1500895 RepID=UPI0005587D0F|nr:hypothetical protein [Erwinia sp. 9145]